ncbi:MAG: hypothetical protein KKA65_01205 [Nanoarchaeota archaeon]|nr:hypothetical protein [Nanoarchaeota archaeon]MBU4352253.1 hypothetical protein [Nanoarchaeota archaeon]MBU4456097.1 hypothetical protein [Nanoarchaeota archaeon]
MNKKGVEITLNFIVIAAIVLIALIVAVLFFTGASTNLFGKIKDVQTVSTQEISLATAVCESHCANRNQAAYENPSFSQVMRDAGYNSCSELPGLGAFQAECSGTCSGPAECSGLPEDLCKSHLNANGIKICNWN